MFEIQWNLICKFLEVKSELITTDVNLDSMSWGNYNNVTRNITSNKAKREGTPWTEITGTKPVNSSILLTTGATEETKK